MQRGQTIPYAKGTVLRDGRYLVEREINRGGSAIVYLAQDLHNNRQVALKVVDYTRDLQMLYKSVKREVQFSAHTQHPNIVQLLDVFADKQRKTLVIVWEFIRGPDLLDCLNRKGGALDEREACFYFCQLLRGLLFMHQTGFAHRDLKPENCVLEDRTQIVRLIDFDLTKHIESARTMLVGTPEYMAPELVRDPTAKFLQYSGGSSSSSRQGYDAKKVDAWAMGVLFYVLIAATYPFSDSNNPGSGTSMATQRALLAGRYKALPPHNSAGARAVVAQLLVVDPEHRASLEDIARDPWLLSTAMSYALPRCLDHLVQPPLAPTPSQTAEVAAAAAAAANPGSHGQQQQHGKMQRTITGGSAVSAVSAASGVTSITTVSEAVTSESLIAHADPDLTSASVPARTSSNASTEKTGRRITEETSTSAGGTSSGAGDLQQQQQQLNDLTPQNGRDQGSSKPAAATAAGGGGGAVAAPKRVMYASHRSFSPGTGGKVGLGEQQLYAVRYEAQAAQRAAAGAGASRGASAKQDSESHKCGCCVIC